MKDACGRDIDYLRISVTDQCNLHCRYCMPPGTKCQPPGLLLSLEELMAASRAAVSAGIRHFKVTGGEPLVRPDAVEFMTALKSLAGVRSVTLTTNGLLLEQHLPRLSELPLDGINVSLDAASEPAYARITGFQGAEQVLSAVRSSVRSGVPTKINTVLLEENSSEWLEILSLAQELPVDVRFIERMPIGCVRGDEPMVPASVLLAQAKARYPDLRPSGERRGNGPAHYFRSEELKGRLGIIAANSQRFCRGCNRLRLTSTGQLRPCLGHTDAIDLRGALRDGAAEADLRELFLQAAASKPPEHGFGSGRSNPARCMNEIGG